MGCVLLLSINTVVAQNTSDTKKRYVALVIKDHEFWFISTNGKPLFSQKARRARRFSEGLAFVDNTYINSKGEVVIKKDTLHMIGRQGEFHEGLAVFYNFGNMVFMLPSSDHDKEDTIRNEVRVPFAEKKFGYINTKGEAAILPAYDWAFDFRDGIALVNMGCKLNSLMHPVGGKYGYINTKGETITPIIYEDAYPFSEGLAAVKNDGKWGFINSKGETVIEFKFDNASSFSEGLAPFKSGGKYGFINTKGEEVITASYDLADGFYNGLAAVNIGGSERKIDDSMVVIREGGKWGYINKEGKMIIPLQFYAVRNFSEGLAAVALNKESYGFIDTLGNTIIPFKYQGASNFSCGFVAVKCNDKWGYIDKKGKWIVTPKFDYAGDFIELENQ